MGGASKGDVWGSRPGDTLDARHVLRLGGLLAKLVRQHGRMGAARELGVSYKTFQRSQAAGRLSVGLREALERYVWEGPGKGESVWWDRMGALEKLVRELEERLGADIERLEHGMDVMREEFVRQIGLLDTRTASLAKRLEEVRETALAARARTDAGAEQTAATEDLSGGTPSEMSGSGQRPTTGRMSDAQGVVAENGAAERLITRWREAKAVEARAGKQLERVKAAAEALEMEIELIHRHGLSIPTEESWAPAKRSREVAWRWEALQDRRRERRRLEQRRWVRRVLTLGLWWE